MKKLDGFRILCTYVDPEIEEILYIQQIFTPMIPMI